MTRNVSPSLLSTLWKETLMKAHLSYLNHPGHNSKKVMEDGPELGLKAFAQIPLEDRCPDCNWIYDDHYACSGAPRILPPEPKIHVIVSRYENLVCSQVSSRRYAIADFRRLKPEEKCPACSQYLEKLINSL